MSCNHLSRVVPAVAVGAALLVTVPVFAQDNGLQQRVTALEAQVETLTRQLFELRQNSTTIKVDCGAGQSLQAALEQVQFRPSRVTIAVFGVCTENIAITRGQLLIRAGAPGAGITAADPSQSAISSNSPGQGSSHATLKGLTIIGGSEGVIVDFGTQLDLIDCVIKDNTYKGVVVDHGARVHLVNSTIEDNGGLTAHNGAHLFMSGGEVRNSTENGVSLSIGATAQITGGALITASQWDGISANGGSMVAFGPATASGNGLAAGLYAGIGAGGGSTVFLWGGAIIDANRGNGIMLKDTSVAQKIRVEKNIHITNNHRWGISCSPGPAVAQLDGFNVNQGTISGNGSGDVSCPKSPTPPQ